MGSMDFLLDGSHFNEGSNSSFSSDGSEYYDDNYNDVVWDMEDKTYVCDYDKIYVCYYEQLHEYQMSKQANKKTSTTIWNNLLVALPTGENATMYTVPFLFAKNVRKPTHDKIKAIVKQKPLVTENNSNNVISSTPPHVLDTEALKYTLRNPQEAVTPSKKKLKKQRQKEKKKEEKKSEVDVRSRSESLAESLESVQDESDENIESTEDIDLSLGVPAFVSRALKKNKMKLSNQTEEKLVKPSNPPKANKKNIVEKKLVENNLVEPIAIIPSTSSLQSSINPNHNFHVKGIKRPKVIGNDYQQSVAVGLEAVKLIMSNRIPYAVQLLSEAILLNSYDLRHFLNRSFCYLRLGAYSLALDDAQVVIKATKKCDELLKAKFRLGQALIGLQRYAEAEKYLDEAYNFSEADPSIQRELMRVKILQLLHMGFQERSVLEVLKERPSVAEAVEILTEKEAIEENEDDYGSECDSDIYNSDDEENPSFTRMLSNVLNYQTERSLETMTKTQHKKMVLSKNIPTNTEVKRIITTIPPKIPPVNKGVNDKAIWVGNTSPDITDNMLRKRFSRFGKIISLYRRPNENYTFINFENSKTVMELLKFNSVDVDGHKLPVKAATKAK